MNPLHYSHHEGISCDHCMKSNFRGKRFKCLVCPDYDLCSSCYESGVVPAGKRHALEHPVQCILTRNDYDVYFGGEQNPIEQIQSFTCPICGKMGFTENLLYDHSVQEHSDTLTQVTCPICCTMQNVEPVLTIEDFTSHLLIEHRSGRGYDTPQELRGRRVPHSNRASVNQTRNHRRQINPSTVILSNINPLLNSLPHDQGAVSNSQLRDLDPITELLSQLRRSQNPAQSSLSSNNFNNTNSNTLHLDRNNFRGNALRQVFERPATDVIVRRHNQASLNQPPITQSNSNSNSVGLSYLLMDTLNNQPVNDQANSTNLTNQSSSPPSNNQFQFLLSTCKEKPKISKELEDVQRMYKSLFIQELLISSIGNFFNHDLKFKHNDKQHINSGGKSNKIDRPSDSSKQCDNKPNDYVKNEKSNDSVNNQFINNKLINESKTQFDNELNQENQLDQLSNYNNRLIEDNDQINESVNQDEFVASSDIRQQSNGKFKTEDNVTTNNLKTK